MYSVRFEIHEKSRTIVISRTGFVPDRSDILDALLTKDKRAKGSGCQTLLIGHEVHKSSDLLSLSHQSSIRLCGMRDAGCGMKGSTTKHNDNGHSRTPY
jgi:hypothetical protein